MPQTPDFLEQRGLEVRLEPVPHVAVGGTEPQGGPIEGPHLDGLQPHLEVFGGKPRLDTSDCFVPESLYCHSPFSRTLSCVIMQLGIANHRQRTTNPEVIHNHFWCS